MLKNLLEDRINIENSAATWQEAVKMAAAPLLRDQFIEERYIDSIIHNVEINGPYIIIMPGFALPHSRPENGVIKTGLSMLKLHTAVSFPEENEASLLVVLAANDANSHLDLIAELTEVLMDDEAMERLFSANSKEEILACF